MNKLPTEKAVENIYEFIQVIDPENIDLVRDNFDNIEIDYRLKDMEDGRKTLEVKTFNKAKAKKILMKLLRPSYYKELNRQ